MPEFRAKPENTVLVSHVQLLKPSIVSSQWIPTSVSSSGWIIFKNVYQRIKFKICCFMFRVFHDWNCAEYLYNLFKKNSASVNPSRRQKFILPKCRTEFTKKSITYQGAVIWNSLPVLLTDTIDFTLFKRTLKTVLFCEALWAFYHSCVQKRVVKPIIINIIIIIKCARLAPFSAAYRRYNYYYRFAVASLSLTDKPYALI